jgi:hypothetical protein
MSKPPVLLALASLLLAAAPLPAQHPRDSEIVSETKDPDTLAWWHTTEALSNDAMEGRDTGSAAYQRAADYVATRFKQAGLQPAGENGTFFQTVPMHEVAVDPAATRFALVRASGGETLLAFLQQITLTPATNLPAETLAPLTFRGYCGKESMQDIAGKIVVCFGTQRQGLPSGGERIANARAGKALGLINVDDPFFTIEPPRWPYAYARTVALGPQPPRNVDLSGLLVMRMDSNLLASFLQGTKQDAAKILAAGGHKQPLPSFEIPAKLRVNLKTTQRAYTSPNVLAVLPGADPALKSQYIVIAAHLDGYGFGTPVQGDNLYNGALDDAAYVALLIQFADDLHAHPQPLKRSVLFCAFTGEEKGLLGSNYFIDHPTIPIPELAADINLDQLRPLFPLHILTALAVDDTTLGASARQVAATMGIEIRPDREPERGLLRRADHAPFLRAGVPAIGFIFGYDPGTDAEKRYRTWYQIQYHRPQDDLTQPIDFEAAAKFDRFFYTLTETLANDPTRPSILPASPLAK